MSAPRRLLLGLVLVVSHSLILVPLRTVRQHGFTLQRGSSFGLSARGRLMDELSTLDEDEETPSAPPVTADKIMLEPETVFFEGPPSWTELVIPGISILTVIGIIPFAAALSRQAWVRYKITSRRISIQSGFGGNDFTEIIYPDIVSVKYVYRSGGEAGDMVIELKDGAKLEMRFVPNFRPIYKYIMERISPEARDASFDMKED
mmetsp:Transcript_5208/g.7333  ORF Transcript_5208/g.7333 Transcript_5208/m.7333 type:complete len:204 (+) Transcript_5208:41-652(+)|eukprot:CAMPEP_0197329130 /NCGR_PEP_ID=MMETSP0892-20130614/5473_1 /TAXON_ID=44058 ORGANISM="Aureoumbra lagunensis, Strain CCMP1510" /NCGR_SAMPLE_ID=MMETSP0892 /ASSEMBLY_ACC=CAM_ASM_000538 /LENGTH=203 /DNA_ID=CAMNT_0042825573 /DNA_START=30 /DNA_END=641 /DNA_ORIENTATION=-